jgi:hypothetical protein
MTKQSLEKDEIASLESRVAIRREEVRIPHRSQWHQKA